MRFQKWHVFFGRGQQQRRQQTKLYIIDTHLYISTASGSWFIITIIIRGHSPLGRPKVFSVLLLLQYYSFFPSFPRARFNVYIYIYIVCIPFQVNTASRVNTRRSLVIFSMLTQIQIYTHGRLRDLYSKWFSISRGSDEMELTCWPEGLSLSVGSK